VVSRSRAQTASIFELLRLPPSVENEAARGFIWTVEAALAELLFDDW
jgi:hypothetical protein